MVLIFELNTAVPVFVPVTFTVRPALYRTEFKYYLQLSPYTYGRQTFFIAAQITFSIAIEDPLYLKPLEQNVRMCDCSDTGNMQLLYNNLGGYLVHVLFSQFVFLPISSPGQTSGKPQYLTYSKLIYIVFYNHCEWISCFLHNSLLSVKIWLDYLFFYFAGCMKVGVKLSSVKVLHVFTVSLQECTNMVKTWFCTLS